MTPDTLLARIAATEAVARAATPGPWEGYYDDSDRPYWGVITERTGDPVAHHYRDGYEEPHGAEGADAYHIALNDPARVLAVCAGVKTLVELHEHSERGDLGVFCDYDGEPAPCPSLAAVAAMFAEPGEES